MALDAASDILIRLDEVRLTERLIAYDTSRPQGLGPAIDFVEGWLEGRGVTVVRRELAGRECLVASVGDGGPRGGLHGHLDVVPGPPDQVSARRGGRRPPP